MKKIELNLDELAVESFETEALDEGAGTVHAHETFDSQCQCPTASCGACPVPESWQSCSNCGCDTPGFTCAPECYPQTEIEAARLA